ncbi:MAG: hypothetical protein PHQ89_00190 [Bacilli bacterium]|nr:hypothetical protein [Bacilli bacterium]
MKILVSAEVFGYGPIITCLNVVKELHNFENVEMDFIGTGIALEQARMTNYFKNFYECRTYDLKELESVKALYLNYDVILSSENINGAIFALKLGLKNVYYIDNLMWMWDKIENGLENLKGYIISETIPCQKNFERIGSNIKNPIFVGPLRDITLKIKPVKLEKKLIINFGGGEAFIIDSSIIKSFYNNIINIIVSNKLVLKNFEKIIICGGSGVINNIVINKKNDKIITKTFSNQEYLKELETCTHCIMAPGLGNFVETVFRDKEIMYLPPINYSQLLQLDYYKKMDLGYQLINWDKFNFYNKIPNLLNEEEGVNLVLENVKKYLTFNNKNTIDEFINLFIKTTQKEYFKKRKEYINNLKKESGKKVAKLIYRENMEV